MKRRVRKKKRIFPIFLYSGILLIVLGIFSLLYIVLFSDFFNIKKAEINLDKVSCASKQDILNASAVIGKNLFFLKPSSIESKIKNNYLCIRSVGIKKQLPDKAVIDISGRVALANLLILKSEATTSAEIASISATIDDHVSDKLLVDNEGVIFDKGDFEGTKLYIGNDLKVGLTLAPGIVKNAVDILSGLKVVNINISKAIIYGDKFLYTESEPKTMFDLSKPPNRQLASLQLILAKFKIDNEAVDSVDLRFENPIVKYKKVKK